MSLPHVILTSLCHASATGYDLTKQFSQQVGYFWRASHQQVYRELNKMAQLGWVGYLLEPQDGKPDRKVYTITEEGRAALMLWLEKPLAPPAVRDEVSAKLYACQEGDSGVMSQHLTRLLDDSKRELANFQELEKIHFADISRLDRQQHLMRLTLRRGIHGKVAWINWIEEALEILNQLPSK
ncbi:hypothetical protein VST7929_02500 [Vibrio stylophorae]|uniref:PadR family transcriptional regulator n=1 Tax=Vibrio stylophorae TaxID=659351 RepID=A0ABM8ZW29_9VIBR|nr:PadR family transcriptional regulator [Vibrio stylophorae]CAH0534556.1 hypothetical protein VST7929_02500 [Vibrio stylophorae]